MMGEKDDFFQSSKSLIANLENRNNVALVSNTLILETIDVLRKKLLTRIKFSGDSRMARDSKKSLVEKTILSFTTKIDDYSESQKILLIEPPMTLSEHQTVILDKFQSYFGHVGVINRCPKCRTDGIPRGFNKCPNCKKTMKSIKKYKYKGLGYVDFEHAYLAKWGKASRFYTTDKAFKSLNGDPDFQSIIFKILSPPKLRTR